MENEGLHILYKNLGETPNQTIERFRVDHPEHKDTTMTYAGRLDPMAEGILLVLSGPAIQNREKYLNLEKTYEFSILWGFETDTLDLLGKVTKSENDKIPSGEEVVRELQKFVGEFDQEYPVYSSKPVSGKPLFKWAREGRLDQIEIPKHRVALKDIKYIGRRNMFEKDLLNEIEKRISLVDGDFRQGEILQKWRENLLKDREFIIDSFVADVSSGFYIRQFVKDASRKLGTPGLTFYIKRTRVGDLA